MSNWISIADLMSKLYLGESIFNVLISTRFDFPSKIQNKKIEVKNSIFSETVMIQGFRTDQPIRFIDCTFEGDFFVEEAWLTSRVEFINCRFNSKFEIARTEISNLFLIETYCKHGLKSNFLICFALVLEQISSNGNTFYFSQTTIKYCDIRKLRDSSEIRFDSGEEYFVESSEGHLQKEAGTFSNISNLFFHADIQFLGSLVLSECHLNKMFIIGFNKGGRIVLQDVIFNKIICISFINTGSISLARLTTESNGSIYISHSNLGKTEIFDIDFTAFHFVTLRNSNIQDIIPTNIIWCKQIDCGAIDNARFSHLRETYRQLKNVMIRHNDKIQELKYHELEMNSYLDQILKDKGKWADRFIVWSNKVSNNHGLSWPKPLVILLSSGLVTYNLNKWLLGYNHLNPSLIPKDFANYIESLNPIRKFELVYTIYHDGWMANVALFLDVLFRIFASYLIFQFISAFRKYVKK